MNDTLELQHIFVDSVYTPLDFTFVTLEIFTQKITICYYEAAITD